uniref:Uncharacterized protein n=1 Tax=mine drainage metagenome TaxID=410659 RepID=E6QK26_9ZZZZ
MLIQPFISLKDSALFLESQVLKVL